MMSYLVDLIVVQTGKNCLGMVLCLILLPEFFPCIWIFPASTYLTEIRIPHLLVNQLVNHFICQLVI